MSDSMSTFATLHSDQDVTTPLCDLVKQSIEGYFSQLDGEAPSNLYDLVLAQTEAPLLKAVMRYSQGNQSKAATLLGISRNTLRKKLAHYNID